MTESGRLEEIGEITTLKDGINKQGKKWILSGIKLKISGNALSLSGFSTTELKEQIAGLVVGDIVSYETEEKGGYLNIVKIEKAKPEEIKKVQNRDGEIRKMFCLKCASKFVREYAKLDAEYKLNFNDVIETAALAEKFIKGEKIERKE